MGMILAAEYVQLLVHAPAQGALRQHALHCEFDGALRVLLQQLAQRNALQVADVAGVMVVELVRELGPRDLHRARVDDDDVIAQVLVGGVVGLVLAFQSARDLRCQTAQSLA